MSQPSRKFTTKKGKVMKWVKKDKHSAARKKRKAARNARKKNRRKK